MRPRLRSKPMHVAACALAFLLMLSYLPWTAFGRSVEGDIRISRVGYTTQLPSMDAQNAYSLGMVELARYDPAGHAIMNSAIGNTHSLAGLTGDPRGNSVLGTTDGNTVALREGLAAAGYTPGDVSIILGHEARHVAFGDNGVLSACDHAALYAETLGKIEEAESQDPPIQISDKLKEDTKRAHDEYTKKCEDE